MQNDYKGLYHYIQDYNITFYKMMMVIFKQEMGGLGLGGGWCIGKHGIAGHFPLKSLRRSVIFDTRMKSFMLMKQADGVVKGKQQFNEL